MCFPTPSRSPPIQLVRYIITVLRNMGYKIIFVRVDEDGALAQSTEFCRMIQSDVQCLLETTGGGNSNNNGISERSNFTRADMMRSLLTTMHILFGKYLPDGITINMFWCFAYSYSGHIMRRLYNCNQNDVPYFVVHKQRPSLRECVIPGSIMTIVSHKKDKLKKLDESRGIKGYFLGFSNHTSVRLYFDPANPTTIKRSTHCIIEDIGTLHALQSVVVSPLHSTPTVLDTPPDILDATSITSQFDSTVIQFPGKKIHTIKLTLPPFPNEIGISVGDDDFFNLPIINRIIPGSTAYAHFPPGLRRNYFIVGINTESPITSGYVIEILHTIQKSSDRNVTIDLVHRGYNNTTTGIAALRATFDTLPSMLLNRPMINSAFSTPNQPDNFVSSATLPPKPKSYFEAMKSPLRFHWKAAAFSQFLKNHNMAVFSIPFPAHELPSDAKVLRSQLVPEVKITDMSGIYELKIRHVIIGTPERRNDDFEESYSPTIDPVTLRIHITLACGAGHVCGVIDVKNAFQNTIGNASSRKYVAVPPSYLNWASSFLGITVDYSIKYYIQMFNSNQGTKDAGNRWYSLVKSVLIKYGFIRSHVDHAYFAKDLGHDQFIYISLATDDLFVSCPNHKIFDDIVCFMKSYFDLSIQYGPVLKFLGLRIIQSDHAISIDQGEYVFDMLCHYFGRDVTHVKTVKAPMRYDQDYEKELLDAFPLSPPEIAKATIEYKGSFRFWTGKLMFLNTQTRPDLSYTNQRLSEYNANPNKVVFSTIVRVLRYLAGDILRPVIYPRQPFSGSTRVSWFSTPETQQNIEVPNTPCLFADAELARCLVSRRSYHCVIITIFNVYVLIKIKKTTTVMRHTTDSEMNATYSGVNLIIPIRKLFLFSGVPLSNPSKAFTDNSAVHAVVDSDRMTSRCRHLDIHVAFLQQEKNKSYQLYLCRTMMMLADMGTKPHMPQYVKLFKYWATGQQFLPPQGSMHYNLLEMQYYEQNFAHIINKPK